MNSQSGSYIEKTYVRPGSIATCIMCSAILSHGGLGIPEAAAFVEQDNTYEYSLEKAMPSVQGKAYQVPSPTWSSIDNASDLKKDHPGSLAINASDSLQVIKTLAFMGVDEDVDNEIERYFASKPIKTKTILINRRIKQG